jgi:transposase-like protein
MARQLLEEGHLSLGEIAARVGVHPTTLYRWRITGKAGTDGEPAGDPAAAPPVEPGPVPPA